MTPYHYCGNNPLAFIDPTGMDSTAYIQDFSGGSLNQQDITDVSSQVKSWLQQNGIPMRVVVLKMTDFKNLDPTDVICKVGGDNVPILQRVKKEKSLGAEGYTDPIGGQKSWANSDARKRGVTNIGLGNIIAHEMQHGMGLSHKTHGATNTLIYPDPPGTTTLNQINNLSQPMSQQQINFILNVFLARK